MQASIIYASDHKDTLPPAADIWDYAKILAEHVGLDDARTWQSRIDPAADSTYGTSIRVLLPSAALGPRRLDPAFREIKPAWAVALGPFNLSMPATTPIAWTRGLKRDGSWAPHSPYGTQGGWITFLGGNTAFYPNLAEEGGRLARFDGQGQTADILEALPPGALISEYKPTPEESAAWAGATRSFRTQETGRGYAVLIPLSVIWLPFVALGIRRFVKRQPGAVTVLLWPLLITILLALLVPIC